MSAAAAADAPAGVGDCVTAPGESCDGVVLVTHPDGSLTVAWESGLVLVAEPEGALPLWGARAGSPAAAALAARCILRGLRRNAQRYHEGASHESFSALQAVLHGGARALGVEGAVRAGLLAALRGEATP